MKIFSRRVLLVTTIASGMLLGGAAPALAQDVDLNDVTDQVDGVTGQVTDQLGEVPALPGQEDGPLQPVADLVCNLTGIEIELLGTCGKEVVPEPVTHVPEKKPAPHKPSMGKKDVGGDVDKGAAPVGGVETGAGGAADHGTGLVLPLSVLGSAAVTGAALAGARRLRSGQVD